MLCRSANIRAAAYRKEDFFMKAWLYYRLSRDEDEEMNSLQNQSSIKPKHYRKKL